MNTGIIFSSLMFSFSKKKIFPFGGLKTGFSNSIRYYKMSKLRKEIRRTVPIKTYF